MDCLGYRENVRVGSYTQEYTHPVGEKSVYQEVQQITVLRPLSFKNPMTFFLKEGSLI